MGVLDGVAAGGEEGGGVEEGENSGGEYMLLSVPSSEGHCSLCPSCGARVTAPPRSL